jgi:hypothetical protein
MLNLYSESDSVNVRQRNREGLRNKERMSNREIERGKGIERGE